MNLPNARAQQAANDNDHGVIASLMNQEPLLDNKEDDVVPLISHEPQTPYAMPSNHAATLRSCNTDEFSEIECLEFLICLSSGRQNARGLAERALETYGCLAKVFQQTSEDLCELLGLDVKTVFLMKVTKSSMKHLVAPRPCGRRELASHDALVDYLALDFRDTDQEILRVIYLDAKCKVIKDEEISRGTVNTVPVYPREIGKRALRYAAASVILAHNHLTDDPTPSSSDIDATIRIDRALRSLDIVLSDHVIIAQDQSFSMRAEGLF